MKTTTTTKYVVSPRIEDLFCLCFCIVTCKIIIASGAVNILRVIYCASFIFTIILKNAYQFLYE